MPKFLTFESHFARGQTARLASWVLFACFGVANGISGSPLTTVEYKISGTQLRISPSVLSVPKAIAGSVLVELVSGGLPDGGANPGVAGGAFAVPPVRAAAVSS